MQNLTITNRQTTVNATQEINGNTANFSWTKNEGEDISAINFYVQRGVVGGEGFTGNNVISGQYYPQSAKFDVQNNNLQAGDLEMYADILAICEGIATEKVAKLKR